MAIAALQHPAAASLGNSTYTFAASYDDDLRLASSSLAATSGGTTLYSTARAYDAVGNVASVGTTLAAGTDQQAFCYDEQNRLVWASSQTGSAPCGGIVAGGSLSAAYYTATYAYDPLNRLTSATAQGSYTYGDAAHLHAATATSSGGYSATYDLAGDLTCRAPNAAVTCAGGSPTGAVLGYDNERRMVSWQSAPSNPGATAGYAYDGEGRRVAQSATAGGSTTTTYYVAGLEEQANVSGGTSTLTKYYSVPGVIFAVNVGGTLSFLASDGLGRVSEALSATSAAATSQQLYGPYGGLRYATGSMPTAKGYTGQYADASSSGLDYYNVRYYDPLVGQFTSADSAADGLNRHGYVKGNPETATDPSGHRICDGGDGCNGGDGGDGGRLPPPPGGHGGHGGKGGGGGGSGFGGGGSQCHSEHCISGGPEPHLPSCAVVEHLCPGDGPYDANNIMNLLDPKWAHGPITAYGKMGIDAMIQLLQDLLTALNHEASEEVNRWTVILGIVGASAGAIAGLEAGPLAILTGIAGGAVGGLVGHEFVSEMFDVIRGYVTNAIGTLRHYQSLIAAWNAKGVHTYDNYLEVVLTARDNPNNPPPVPGLPGLNWIAGGIDITVYGADLIPDPPSL